MTRNYFDKELLKLHRELTEMGRRVDEIMSETLFALKRQDREAARRVVEGTTRSTAWRIRSSRCA